MSNPFHPFRAFDLAMRHEGRVVDLENLGVSDWIHVVAPVST